MAIYGSGYKCSCMLCHARHINPSAVIFPGFDGLLKLREFNLKAIPWCLDFKMLFFLMGLCLMVEHYAEENMKLMKITQPVKKNKTHDQNVCLYDVSFLEKKWLNLSSSYSYDDNSQTLVVFPWASSQDMWLSWWDIFCLCCWMKTTFYTVVI